MSRAKLPRVRVITDASACACPCLRATRFEGRGDKPTKPTASCLLCKGSGKTTVGRARRFASAMEDDSQAYAFGAEA